MPHVISRQRRERQLDDFDSYCEEILPRLVAFGFRITRDQRDAEDVAIETLARTMVRWPKIRDKEWRDGWVFRVTANFSIDTLRKRQRAASLQDSDLPVEAEMPDTSLEMTDVLGQLPPRQREVLVLRYYGDLTYADIATKLCLSEGSVKTHLHRGMRSLRQLLNAYS